MIHWNVGCNWGTTPIVKFENLRILPTNVQRFFTFICSFSLFQNKIKLILNKYKGIQMLAVTETHLSTQIHDSEIAIDGYIIFRKDR